MIETLLSDIASRFIDSLDKEIAHKNSLEQLDIWEHVRVVGATLISQAEDKMSKISPH